MGSFPHLIDPFTLQPISFLGKRHPANFSQWAFRLVPSRSTSCMQMDLLRWYGRCRRDLPWRRTRDPYRIWVSEILLQQTRVETARIRYEAFFARFPTLARLAEAPLDEVLAAWQGLGYYSRARNLHRAARHVANELGGRIPDDLKALESLPGIGPYTARAIASIAFHKDAAALDGNVARVLCRLFALPLTSSSPTDRVRLQQLADRLLPKGKASSFNQAMMDLGALVCTPRSPKCATCPVARHCRSFRKGLASLYPVSKPKAPLSIRRRLMAAVFHRGAVLLQKRHPEGLLAGLWELPARTVEKAEAESHAWESLKRDLSQIVEISPSPGTRLLGIEHRYTHFRERISIVICTARPLRRPSSLRTWELPLRWVHRKKLFRYGLTGVTVKALRALAAQGFLENAGSPGPGQSEPVPALPNGKRSLHNPCYRKVKA